MKLLATCLGVLTGVSAWACSTKDLATYRLIIEEVYDVSWATLATEAFVCCAGLGLAWVAKSKWFAAAQVLLLCTHPYFWQNPNHGDCGGGLQQQSIMWLTLSLVLLAKQTWDLLLKQLKSANASRSTASI
ncbi:MAG: hypothetical protein ACAH95_01570 [Fimbriimonas sp.]